MRWEEQKSGIQFAYAGERIIGLVVPVGAGPHAGQVTWTISAVAPSKYQRATHGYCHSIAVAKQAFRRAWLTWLRERGLAEVS